jgi:hypothetical protein
MPTATKKAVSKKQEDPADQKIVVDPLEGYFLSLAMDEMPSESQEEAYAKSGITYLQAKREVSRVKSVLIEQEFCGTKSDRDALAKQLSDHLAKQQKRNAEIDAIVEPLLTERREMQVETERLEATVARQRKAIDRLRKRYPAEIAKRIESVQRLYHSRGLHERLGAAKRWVERLQNAINAQSSELYNRTETRSVDRGEVSYAPDPTPLAFGLASTAEQLGLLPKHHGPSRKPLPLSMLAELRERASQELPTALEELSSAQADHNAMQGEIERLKLFYVPM